MVDGFRPCVRAASSSRIRRGVSRKTSSYVKQTGLIGTRLSFPPLFKIYTPQEAIRVGRLRPRATHRKRPRIEPPAPQSFPINLRCFFGQVWAGRINNRSSALGNPEVIDIHERIRDLTGSPRAHISTPQPR